ncbi:MAG: acyltransferase family protein [Huintestinicola sp.]|uniref:acyltransferase family protein n=1 Tax=Huintestinicola sp. TaxID=2981661 RepID=UPI003F0D9C78
MEQNITQKSRKSNIELCRIICMMMIIAHHLVYHGRGIHIAEPIANRFISYIFLPGGKIGFDAFIAITAYFITDSSFKAERFFKIYLEVIFYSVITTAAALMTGLKMTIPELIGALLPITGAVQGYAATYLAFYLLLPFLTAVSKHTTDKQNCFLVGVLTVFVIFSRVIGPITSSEQDVYCRLILFVYFYFLMIFLKRHPVKWLEKPLVTMTLFIINWALIVSYHILPEIIPIDEKILQFMSRFLSDEGGLLNITAGLLIFFFFKSINIKQSKWINITASTTLGVLLLHDGHFSRSLTWRILKPSSWIESKYYILMIFASVLIVFIYCAAFDIMRKRLLETPFFKTERIRLLCRRIDEYVAPPAETSAEARYADKK